VKIYCELAFPVLLLFLNLLISYICSLVVVVVLMELMEVILWDGLVAMGN